MGIYLVMDSFNKLTDLFRHFPGIGPRQAKRFVYFLLSQEPEFSEELSRLAETLKKENVQCKECFRFFQKRGNSLCPPCADPNRNSAELMIVAKDTDLEAMEKSGSFHGRYFVLGGTIPLIASKTPERLRLKELRSLVERRIHPRASASSNRRESAALKEIILGFSANPDGEHTSDELRKLLAPFSLKITTLGRGLSTGSELEYADHDTLTSALKNRL